MARIAVIQQAPVFLDRAATLARAVDAVHEAAAAGAALVVFPEAFIPGCPAWIWQLRPSADIRLIEWLPARLRANAVSLAGDDLQPLRQAAKERELTVVCDIEEVDADEWINGGDSVIEAPGGKIVDGHYARPDIFRLQINTRRFAPVEFAAHE